MTVHPLPTATLTAPATGPADPTSSDDKLSLAEILLTTAMDLRAAGVLDEASELAHRVVARSGKDAAPTMLDVDLVVPVASVDTR